MSKVADVELAHGYTLADVACMSRIAVSAIPLQMSKADAYDDCWATIVEKLYSADEAPPPAHLIVDARNAVYRGYRDDMRHHGVYYGESGNERETAPHFAAYWAQRHVTTFEDSVVEAVSLAQIWPRLTAGQQTAIVALAVWGSFTDAAIARNEPRKNTTQLVRDGRKRFLRLWHEGEKPSHKWGMDHPGNGGLGKYRKVADANG